MEAADPGLPFSSMGMNSTNDVEYILLGCMMAILFVLTLATLWAARRSRLQEPVIIKLVSTGEAPILSLDEGKQYHCFISHVWATGQDQAAMIKRRLVAMMPPGLRVFLDVDDLEDISQLEVKIQETALVFLFLSKARRLLRGGYVEDT